MGLFMGYLVDRYSRKWILVVSTLVWNLLTALAYFSNTFAWLLIPRIIVGTATATCVVASISLINDYFPHSERGRANGVFFFGAYIGSGVSSLTILINESLG